MWALWSKIYFIRNVRVLIRKFRFKISKLPGLLCFLKPTNCALYNVSMFDYKSSTFEVLADEIMWIINCVLFQSLSNSALGFLSGFACSSSCSDFLLTACSLSCFWKKKINPLIDNNALLYLQISCSFNFVLYKSP